MNIAFVSYTQGAEKFCRGLRDAFKARGHKIRHLYQVGDGRDDLFQQMSWGHFSFRELRDFKPDHVFVFNGWADETKPATELIAQTWATSFFEVGWLPQSGFIYVDHEGLGGRSRLAKRRLSDELFDQEIWDKLTTRYKPDRRPRELPKNYVLVPLQLEHDTSIKYDSPYFKKMSTLIQFASKAFDGKTLLFKTHPKAKEVYNFPRNSFVVHTNHTMNTLAAYADCIMGINSTSLIEALIHLKPIATLGYNVLSGSDLWMHPPKTLTSPKSLLTFKPNVEEIKRALCELYRQQIPWEGPSPQADAVVKAVER